MSGRTLALAWARFQPRTVGLARELGGQAEFVHDRSLAAHRALTPLRYLLASARTWRLLSSHDPGRAIVVTPPVFAPLVTWLWCRLHRRQLYVDCHTDAFDSRRWRWARPLHRWLLRRADGVLLHTEPAAALVTSWGARARLVPDDVPGLEQASWPALRRPGVVIVVAGSLDGNEPVAETLAAAARLPGYRFRLTGDPARLPRALVCRAPANVEWTGYLAYPEFLGALVASTVVAVFSIDPGTMSRAAFEAVGLGRPLLLTDFPGLRTRFGEAAAFTDNEPAAMAAAVEAAVAAADDLARRSRRLARRLAEDRRRALADLVG